MSPSSGPTSSTPELTPFRALLEHSPTLDLLHDNQGRLLGVSKPLADLLGADPEALIGASVENYLPLDVLHPGEGDWSEGGMIAPLQARPADLIRDDGVRVPTIMSATPVPNATGSIIARLCTLFDATEIRQTEVQLKEAVTTATDASLAKSRFLAAMSHEIRTPMNAILGFAQLLKLSNLDDKRQSHVSAIIRAGGTLMNLLTDLLDLGQVEAGRMRIEMRPFDLQPMLDQVADWWYSSANEKGLRLNISLDPGLPERVITDPVRLQQILNNFLSNALKYTDAGHVVLSVEQVGHTDTSTCLRFSVTDTGIGMSEAQLGNLFKPFVQIESDFGKERGGWGLGLSICRNIADMMGAEIGVTSTPGQGSIFYFELDMATAPAPDLASDVKGVPASGLRILIAEDNAMNQDVMRTMLRDFGHEVVTVSNGFEAVEAMLKGRFDAVLMDITMPGLDGLGATEQIRNADGQIRRVPIVACSAHVGADVQDRYRRAGIDDFLSKPVDRDALAEMILRVVAQK